MTDYNWKVSDWEFEGTSDGLHGYNSKLGDWSLGDGSRSNAAPAFGYAQPWKVQNGTYRQVYDFVRDHPGSTGRDVQEGTGLPIRVCYSALANYKRNGTMYVVRKEARAKGRWLSAYACLGERRRPDAMPQPPGPGRQG